MNGLKKLVLISTIAAAPLAAQAELQAVDDAMLSEMTGQSGLLVEVGFGTVDATDITNVNWDNASVTIDAFKWEVDLEAYDSDTNIHLDAPTGVNGGLIAQDIKVAGAFDLTIDGVADASGHGGIAIGFANSNKCWK